MAEFKSELVDQDGNPPSDNWRELRTKKGWARKKAEEEARAEEKKQEGTHNRSIGEHALAVGRNIFEGERYRDKAAAYGERDPKNPLYDRRRVKPKYEDEDEDEKPKRRPVLYDKD